MKAKHSILSEVEPKSQNSFKYTYTVTETTFCFIVQVKVIDETDGILVNYIACLSDDVSEKVPCNNNG